MADVAGKADVAGTAGAGGTEGAAGTEGVTGTVDAAGTLDEAAAIRACCSDPRISSQVALHTHASEHFLPAFRQPHLTRDSSYPGPVCNHISPFASCCRCQRNNIQTAIARSFPLSCA
ncbi:unnamed protein product, partial [Ectocarpus fasciculatus]